MKKLVSLFAALLLVCGCSRTMQTSSGQQYLSSYKPATYGAVRSDEKGGEATPEKTIEEKLREVAAVEPTLTFPTSIGLARIENGALTAVPLDELEIWNAAAEKLGAEYGSFVPLSPMVARMVGDQYRSPSSSRGTDNIVDIIRLGAARQHTHTTLIYEVITKASKQDTILSATNVTIIGGLVVPSKIHETEAVGNGLFIDVMQGYPYGTISSVVEKQKRVASSWGWGSDDADTEKAADKVKIKLVQKLANETVDLLQELRGKLEQARQEKAPATP